MTMALAEPMYIRLLCVTVVPACAMFHSLHHLFVIIAHAVQCTAIRFAHLFLVSISRTLMCLVPVRIGFVAWNRTVCQCVPDLRGQNRSPLPSAVQGSFGVRLNLRDKLVF